MNSVEVIEGIISSLYRELDFLIQKYEKEKIYPSWVEVYVKNKQDVEEQIKIFQQIKKELEEYNEIKAYGISYENFKSFKEQ